jgi:hypothetical protein
MSSGAVAARSTHQGCDCAELKSIDGIMNANDSALTNLLLQNRFLIAEMGVYVSLSAGN